MADTTNIQGIWEKLSDDVQSAVLKSCFGEEAAELEESARTLVRTVSRIKEVIGDTDKEPSEAEAVQILHNAGGVVLLKKIRELIVKETDVPEDSVSRFFAASFARLGDAKNAQHFAQQVWSNQNKTMANCAEIFAENGEAGHACAIAYESGRERDFALWHCAEIFANKGNALEAARFSCEAGMWKNSALRSCADILKKQKLEGDWQKALKEHGQ